MTPAERDAAILEHLRRYHLTTPEILHLLFFPDVGLNAVRKVTSRLIRERRIIPARLFEQRKYFVLTPREAERLGEHRSIGRKFQYQGLVNAYAVLSFCAAHDLKKLTPREFADWFPHFVIPGVRSGNYYVETEQTPEGQTHRLGFIHVDYGVSPATIVKKVDRIIARTQTLPAFDKAVRDGKFVVTILVPTAEKAEEVKAALRHEPTGNVRFRIEAVTELGDLLTRRGRLKENRTKRSDKPTKPELPKVPSAEGAAEPAEGVA